VQEELFVVFEFWFGGSRSLLELYFVSDVSIRCPCLTNAYDTKCMQSKIQGCLYTMLHIPCQMQEMHKGKLYICYKGGPTHPTQEIKHTPSSPRKRVKVA
jgi:hypothetical protein